MGTGRPRKAPPDVEARSMVPIGDLSADPANLRVHGERSLEALVGSLRRFGQQKPIIFDRNKVVVAGNGTLEAARRLGLKQVWAVRSDLVGVDRTAYAIADNRTGELSAWDDAALRTMLESMPPDAVRDAGYTQEELETLLAPADPEHLDDEPPPAPLPKAVTRSGELWILGGKGGHRLLCGDSTKAADVQKVIDGRSVRLVATDPPYLVDYTGERPSKGDRSSGKDWSESYHEIDIKDADGFFRAVFTNVLSVLCDHSPIYCWHAHRRCGLIQRIWEELGILDHQQIIWVKPGSVLGRVFWHFRHEPCMMGWRKGSMPAHDNEHEFNSVWECDWEGKARVVGNEHPTQKPIELFARPMRKHTKRGDVCFEPFSGSGTQLLAAEQLGRRCYAIELEPVFVDVAVRRWQALTGKEATLGAKGPTWAATAKRRHVAVPKPKARPAEAAA